MGLKCVFLRGKKKLYEVMGKDQNGGGSGGRPVDARVARRRQDPIGRRLRKLYEDVVEENVPDDFLSILEDVDGRQAETAGETDGGEPAEAEPRGLASQSKR